MKSTPLEHPLWQHLRAVDGLWSSIRCEVAARYCKIDIDSHRLLSPLDFFFLLGRLRLRQSTAQQPHHVAHTSFKICLSSVSSDAGFFLRPLLPASFAWSISSGRYLAEHL